MRRDVRCGDERVQLHRRHQRNHQHDVQVLWRGGRFQRPGGVCAERCHLRRCDGVIHYMGFFMLKLPWPREFPSFSFSCNPEIRNAYALIRRMIRYPVSNTEIQFDTSAIRARASWVRVSTFETKQMRLPFRGGGSEPHFGGLNNLHAVSSIFGIGNGMKYGSDSWVGVPRQGLGRGCRHIRQRLLGC